MAHDHAHSAHAHGQSRGHSHGHAGGHSHGHSHGRGHEHDVGGANETRIGLAAVLTGAFMGVEVAGGLLAGSLALIADAGHMLSDFGSLALAWIGFRMARRPADARRTFGFRRFPVLAAFVNGLTLFAIVVWILAEAGLRLFYPRPVEPQMMLWVASAGLAVNVFCFALLHGADHDNLNVRGALLHVAGDILGSLAAILAAVIIMLTGWQPADPVLSIVMSLIILRSAWRLTSESAHILLEGAPNTIDLEAVIGDLAAHVEGVVEIHHAHLWSLDGQSSMITLHARIQDGVSGPDVIARIKTRLLERHGVGHATIEIEGETCAGGACS